MKNYLIPTDTLEDKYFRPSVCARVSTPFGRFIRTLGPKEEQVMFMVYLRATGLFKWHFLTFFPRQYNVAIDLNVLAL